MGRLIASKGFRLYSFTEEGLQRTYKKRKLDEKFPVVCNECNHGWMSDLENRHAKPAIKDLILSDKLTKLTPERLDSIAKFAFKTAVVADHYSRPEQPFFPASARYAFRESLMIPRGVQMWISAFKGSGHGALRGYYHTSSAEARHRFELYTLTFGSGYFIVQVVGSRWFDSIRAPGRFPVLTSGPYWNKFSAPFWPSDGRVIEWPLDKQFTLGRFNQFTDRFKDLTVPTAWL